MQYPQKTSSKILLPSSRHYPRDRSNTWVNGKQWAIYVFLLIIADVVAIGFSFLIAYLIRFYIPLPIFKIDIVPSFPFYQSVSFVLIFLFIFIFAINGLYDRRNLLGGTKEYALAFRTTGIGLLLIIIAGFLDPNLILARGWLITAWLVCFLFVAMERFILRRVIYAFRENGFFLSKTIIIGANEEGMSLTQQLLSWRTSGLRIVGFVDDTVPMGQCLMDKLVVLGKISDLSLLVRKYNIDEIIICTSATNREQMIELFGLFGMRYDINLRLSSGLYEIITTGVEVDEIAYVPLVSINKVKLRGFDLYLKTCLDFTIAIAALILLFPVFIVLAILIKLDSEGPVFHLRKVKGVNGTEFLAYKFRTMYINGDEILAKNPELAAKFAAEFKLKSDPRVTRIGNWLRRSSLDELPQLFNVIKGEMSLIGPRMISPEEVEMYRSWGLNLLTVKPGISGLWQTNGRSNLSYEERVQLDMYYIRNWTIWLDIQIMLQTFRVIFSRDGAY